MYSRRGALCLVGTITVAGLAGCGEVLYDDRGLPEADFSWEYTPDVSNDYGVVTITHAGGDSLKAEWVFVRGNGFTDAPSLAYDISGSESWIEQGETTTVDDVEMIKKGNTITVGVYNDYQLVVAYQAGDPSVRLSNDTGPEAQALTTAKR